RRLGRSHVLLLVNITRVKTLCNTYKENVMGNSQDGMGSTDPQDELNDLRMSEEAIPLLNHVKRFIKETVDPMYEEFTKLGEGNPDRWSFTPEQLEVLQKAKDKAKEEGLWNFFLPDAETDEGLSN